MPAETTMNKQAEIADMNRRILDHLENGETRKVAQAASEYTRTQVREEGFTFNILPLEPGTDDDLDRALDERLQCIIELEPDSPGAKWAALQEIPDGEYMTGSRYILPIARVLTRRFWKDLDELRTYRQDLRRILTDNSIKDGLAEIDGKFTALIRSIAEDTAGAVPGKQLATGKVQWRAFSGGLTKENFIEAKKMLPRGSVDHVGKYRLRNYVALMNDVTAQDFSKLDSDEIGDANVGRMFTEGLTENKFWNVKPIYTIKDDLIPDNTVYFFPAPEFLGRAKQFTDWTTHVKKEAYFIESFSWWLGGFAIGNIAGVCKAEFDAS